MNKQLLTDLINKFLNNQTTHEENDFLKAYDDSFDKESAPELSENQTGKL